MLSELPKRKILIYIDNYLTSLRLMQKLTGDGLGCTGTMHTNRKDKTQLKPAEKNKKKKI